MRPKRNTAFLLKTLLLFLPLLPAAVHAQTSQFLPEVDVLYRANNSLRVDFQVKDTREGGDPAQVEIGPSLNLFAEPLVSLENIPIFDPEKSKSRLLQGFVGYRHVVSQNKSDVERIPLGFVVNLPVPGKILLADRNRADLDWSSGPFVWRYRNRLKLQRAVSLGGYKPAPYASAEVFYQSQFAKWSNTAIHAGCLFPIKQRLALDAYYEHQNQTGNTPNKQLNQLGLILNIYLGQNR
ncbi:DUF2490 domain-containing protein [Occallatibacter riparius]|uniref:DUF2490 domain-containing protein n=1 Tax=Occallatibacter riparius TaxID=1002689 RepID=A0A9J7BUW9_9BACT|nr:DUF2490 domain-containing protein [Occallatibacter riparius]UWZ84805.1 DUF2490 domain-containing protein [Occallatibacter riparius]